ncbi:MAG: FGGY-family carbohydrate kinase [bacterium]
MAVPKKYVLGIDVGTGSVRTGLFDLAGKKLAVDVVPIKLWKPKPDYVEQSSENIWQSVCATVKAVMKSSGVKPEQIIGLGFDATCSLVVLDKSAKPISVSPTRNPDQNIIVWMDHRAIDQAQRINATKHKVLRYVGGIISPEMESPKLLWLKENMPAVFKHAGYFFDLPDYLVFRATGDTSRSLCSTVCKWTYQGHLESEPGSDSIGRWDGSYWTKIGIPEFAKERFERIGRRVRPMGEPIGQGLTAASAKELGLKPGTAVGVSIIDAHAGGLGLLGIQVKKETITPSLIETRVALIGGTSTCHMAASRKPYFINGIWGPYYSAMIPGMWLTEGGQSATGALIDHVIYSHARSKELESALGGQQKSIYEVLEKILDEMAKKQGLVSSAFLTQDRHVLPYFHGNRSPRANPTLRGMMTGLTLNNSVEELAVQYLSTLQAIAYGTRHIIETMNQNGYRIKHIFATGGGTKSKLYLREHADATGCPIIMGQEPEAVILGSAILGAVASGVFPNILSAMQQMSRKGKVIEPNKGKIAEYHNKKYKAFLNLYESFMELRKIMQ